MNEDKSTLERLLDFLPDAVVASDADGRIVLVNDQGLRLFGFSQAELIGQPVELLMPERFAKAHREHRENYNAAPRTRPMGIGLDLLGRRKDGTEFPVDISLRPMITRDGILILASIRDSTLQKQYERELSARVAQQAAAAELALHGLRNIDLPSLLGIVVARVARTLAVEFCSVFESVSDGGSFRVLEGAGWQEGTVGSLVDAAPDFMAGYTRLARKVVVARDLAHEIRFEEEPMLKAHGVIGGMTVPIGEDVSPWGILGVYSGRQRNFTLDDAHFLQTVASLLAGVIQRKDMEVALRASEGLHRQIVETANEGIWMVDGAGKVSFANQRMAALLGCSVAEILGRSYLEFLDEPSRTRAEQDFEQHRLGVRGVSDHSFLGKDGSRFWASVSSSPLFDGQGRFSGVLAMTADITKRKLAEGQIRQSYHRDSQS